MRGKYATKAANRLAEVDNTLLREQLDKIAALEAELARVNLELTHCKTTVSSQVIREAARQSRKRIAEIESEYALRIAAIESKRDENGLCCADQLWRYFTTTGNKTIPQFIVGDLIPRLVPRADLNDFINSHLEEAGEAPATRRGRRHAAENIRRAIHRDANDDRDVVPKTAMAAVLGDEKAQNVIRSSVGRDAE